MRTSTVNSTTTPLSAPQTFRGVGETSPYTHVSVACKTDAACTLYVEFSLDNENWDSSLVFDVEADKPEYHVLQKNNRFVRVRLSNGTSDQTYLRLQTDYGNFTLGNNPVSAVLTNDADALLTKQLSEETLVAEGLYSGRRIVNKFGQNNDVDGPEDVWEGGGDYSGFPTGSAGTIDIWSSTLADNGSVVVILGLDENYDDQTMSYTITATTTSTELWQRNYTTYVKTAPSGYESNAGDIIVNRTGDPSVVFSKILAGLGQTRQAVFTVPNNHIGILVEYSGYMFDNSANAAELAFWIRPQNGAVRYIQQFKITTDVPVDRRLYGGIKFEPKTDLKIRCSSVTNTNAEIEADFDIKVIELPTQNV